MLVVIQAEVVGEGKVRVWEGWGRTYVELPALDVLACIFIRDHDDQLGDLAADHPLIQLGHDLLDIRSDLVVCGDEHVEAIFLNTAGREYAIAEA